MSFTNQFNSSRFRSGIALIGIGFFILSFIGSGSSPAFSAQSSNGFRLPSSFAVQTTWTDIVNFDRQLLATLAQQEATISGGGTGGEPDRHPIRISKYRNSTLPRGAKLSFEPSSPERAAKGSGGKGSGGPTTFSPPTLALDFDALDDGDPSITLPRGSNRGIPPDTQGAVGPTHIMTVTNLGVRIHDRGGHVIGTVSLRGFFGIRYVTDAFDPYIIYDSTSKRFIFQCDAQGEETTSSICIAVSASSDPTGIWYIYRFDADPVDRFWADYPRVAVNKNWITITSNSFALDMTDFQVNIWAFDKKAALKGKPMAGTVFTSRDGDTIVPAAQSNSSTQYLVNIFNHNVDGHSSARLFTITGSSKSPIFTTTDTFFAGAPYSVLGDFTQGLGGQLPPAPQLGADAGDGIETNDDRMLNAIVSSSGHLWFSHEVGILSDDKSPVINRTAIQWWEVIPSTGTVVQTGILDGGPDFYFFFPSIAVNKFNEVLIGFSASSPETYASGYFAYRAPTDPPGQFQQLFLLREGEAAYKIHRWGDYSATMVDPANSINFWTVQEFAIPPLTGLLTFFFPASAYGTWWGYVVSSQSSTGTR